MVFDITKPLPQYYEHEGRKYKLNLAFDNVLNVFDLFKNKDLMDFEKAQFALEMLFENPKNVPLSAIDTIFTEFISIVKKSSKSSLKIIDFRQDGIYIYSSFMADYGIDLFKEQGKLHWWQFISLFQGLSSITKIKEVMSIRQKPFPKPTKYNAEEIANLHELKEYYALEISQEEREQNFKNGLEGLAQLLISRAKE